MEIRILRPVRSQFRSNMFRRHTVQPRRHTVQPRRHTVQPRRLRNTTYVPSRVAYPTVRVPPSNSFMSEVCLYDLSYADILLSSACKNMLFMHMPLLFVYRQLRVSWNYAGMYILLSAFLKTCLQIAEMSNP